jgi:trehalose 6-phosphate phosphatase
MTPPPDAPDNTFSGPPPLKGDFALFLDIDGTLLEVQERPELVRVDDELRDLMAVLLAACNGAVALISGRALADMDCLFAPLQLPAAGQHGAERRDTSGRLHRYGVAEEKLHAVAARLRRLVANHPGLILEDKGLNIALHYRLAPHLEGLAREAIAGVIAELGDRFETQAGKMVFEAKLKGRDKGTAVAEFMQERPFLNRTPVFIGDDLTDEHGFDVVNALGGHAVKVGEGSSRARWQLADPNAVHSWLRDYVRMCHAG